jgi:hypothetical protein
VSTFIRRIPMLLGSIAVVFLVASCTEKASVSSITAPTKPALGYAPVHGCDNLTPATMCTGSVTTSDPLFEALKVCKVYPGGTGPDVQIKMNADYVMFQSGPQSGTYTLHAGECLIIWRNGEFVGNVSSTDIITVSEVPVPGYTTTSQVTTIIRDQALPGDNSTFTTTPGPVTSATSATTSIGGARIPGAVVTFTNTAIAQPSCALTQGYWKNHESQWPAPYSPTAQWLNSTHKVNGVTWDGLMGMSVAGGNSYMQLAHQWIAATLNLGGAIPSNPSVAAAMSQGEAWLQANTPASTNTVPNIKNAQATAWASTLDDFNNGNLGTPHCE